MRCCCYCTVVIVYFSAIKKLWTQDLWCNVLHVWMVIVKCLWGIICVIFLFLVNCWPWRRELPPVRVRVYSSLIYALTAACARSIGFVCTLSLIACFPIIFFGSTYVLTICLCKDFWVADDLTDRRRWAGLNLPHLQYLMNDIVPQCSTKEESKAQHFQASNTLSLSSSFKNY